MAITDNTQHLTITRQGPGAALARVVRAWRIWRQERRDRAELRALGPGALKDLGLDLSEIGSLVAGGGRDGTRRRRG